MKLNDNKLSIPYSDVINFQIAKMIETYEISIDLTENKIIKVSYIDEMEGSINVQKGLDLKGFYAYCKERFIDGDPIIPQEEHIYQAKNTEDIIKKSKVMEYLLKNGIGVSSKIFNDQPAFEFSYHLANQKNQTYFNQLKTCVVGTSDLGIALKRMKQVAMEQSKKIDEGCAVLNNKEYVSVSLSDKIISNYNSLRAAIDFNISELKSTINKKLKQA